MIIKDGKEYRNLEEQVLKNKNDIAYWMTQLANYGFKVIGKVATAGSLPNAQTYTGAYGDAYAVGSNSPYYIYVYARPNNGGLPYWTNIGQFPLKGDTGAAGADGADGTSTMWYADSGYPTVAGNEGDMYLNTSNYYVYRFETGAWVYKCNIKGATGDIGPAPTVVAGTATATQVSSTDPAAVYTSVTNVSTGVYALNIGVDIPQGATGATGVGVDDITLVQNLNSNYDFEQGSVSVDAAGIQYTSTGYIDYGDSNISPTFTMDLPITNGTYTTITTDDNDTVAIIDADADAISDYMLDTYGVVTEDDFPTLQVGRWYKFQDSTTTSDSHTLTIQAPDNTLGTPIAYRIHLTIPQAASAYSMYASIKVTSDANWKVVNYSSGNVTSTSATRHLMFDIVNNGTYVDSSIWWGASSVSPTYNPPYIQNMMKYLFSELTGFQVAAGGASTIMIPSGTKIEAYYKYI